LLGPDLVIAQTAIAAAEASLKEFDSVTGGSMSATYDPTKAQATILSFISNAQQVVTVVQQAMPKISASNVLTSIGNYAAAVQALFSFLQIAIGLSSVSVSVPPKMTEAQALKLATH
jgi:hypothetical protein